MPDNDDPIIKASKNLENQREYFHQLVTNANQDLAPYERVINFALLDRDFDIGKEELTPKDSFNRKSIERNFAEQIKELYFNDKKTIGEISKIVDITIEPLRIRMNKVFKLRKYPVRYCDICKKDIHRSCYSKHVKTHWKMLRSNIRCRHCGSFNLVRNGFAKREKWVRQILLCRECNKTMYLGTSNRKKKRTN